LLIAGTDVVSSVPLAVGALVAPSLARVPGTRASLAALGALLLVAAAAYAGRCFRLDRSMPAPGPELALMRGLPVFAPLPLVTVEQLVHALEPQRFERGDSVIAEGYPADRFHIIVKGTATVAVHGVERPLLVPGDVFGEIALIRDVPRTATIIAVDPLITLTPSTVGIPRCCERQPGEC
jgi:hypothetical protein